MENGKVWWASFLGDGANGELASALAELVSGGSGPEWERAVGVIAASGRSASGMLDELARLRKCGPAGFSLGLPGPESGGPGGAAAIHSFADGSEWAKAATVAAGTIPGTAMPSEQAERLATFATLSYLAGAPAGNRMEKGLRALEAGFAATAAAEFLAVAAESHGDHATSSVAYAGAASCSAVLGDWRGAEALVRTCTFLSAEQWGSADAEEGTGYRIFLDGIFSAPESSRGDVGTYVLRCSDRVFAPAFPSLVAACHVVRCVHAAGALQAAAEAFAGIFSAAERESLGLPFPDVVFAYGQSTLFPSPWTGMGKFLAVALERQVARGCGDYPLETAEAVLYLSAAGYPDEGGPAGAVIESAARLAGSERLLAAKALATLAPRAASGAEWQGAYAAAVAALEPSPEPAGAGTEALGEGERAARDVLALLASYGTALGAFPRRLLEVWTVAAFRSGFPAGFLEGARTLLAGEGSFRDLAGAPEREAFPALLGDKAPEGTGDDVLTEARWSYLNAYETVKYEKCTAFLDRISLWTEA